MVDMVKDFEEARWGVPCDVLDCRTVCFPTRRRH